MEHAALLLVQALVISRLDYCNALLAGLPSCTINLLQIIQNHFWISARLVFNEPKRAHVTPLFISLHWLLVAARIKSGIQALPRTTSLLQISLLQIYIPSRSLRSTSDRCLMVPSQRGTKSLFRTFSLFHIYCSWLVEQFSYIYPECWFPDKLQVTAENSSLSTLFDFIKKKNFVFLFIYSFPF